MKDEKGHDLNPSCSSPRFTICQRSDLSDTHLHKLKEIKDFFETYKRLEPRKWVNCKSWEDAIRAKDLIILAINFYREHTCARTSCPTYNRLNT
jgi:inorganic pyrophosphatase